MRAFVPWFLWFANLSAIVGGWYWNASHHPLGNLLTLDASSQMLAWGRLAGLLAVFFILLQLLIIGRVRWIEHAYGLDRLARLHHYQAFLALALVAAHAGLLTTGYALQKDVGRVAQLLDFAEKWEDLPAALGAFGLMAVLVLISLALVRRRWKYEWWHGAHLLFYAAILLAFGHQLGTGGDFVDQTPATVYWWSLYGFVLINLLVYRVARPWFLFMRHRFVVRKLVQETPDAMSVHIEGRNIQRFAIRAGQFLIVRFWAPGFRGEAHPFSLSCTPSPDGLRISVRQLGDFTRRLSQLKPGTPVLIDGPHGTLTADLSRQPGVVLLAGGIGITPLRGLAEDLLAAGKDVTLLYMSRTRRGAALVEELQALGPAARWRLHLVLSHDPGEAVEHGRLDGEKLDRLVPDVKDRDVFLCGPPALMTACLRLLRERNVPRRQIHFERFAL